MSPDSRESRDQFESWYKSLRHEPQTEIEILWTLRWNMQTEQYMDNRIDLAWRAWRAALAVGDACRDGCKIKRWVKEAEADNDDKEKHGAD